MIWRMIVSLKGSVLHFLDGVYGIDRKHHTPGFDR